MLTHLKLNPNQVVCIFEKIFIFHMSTLCDVFSNSHSILTVVFADFNFIIYICPQEIYTLFIIQINAAFARLMTQSVNYQITSLTKQSLLTREIFGTDIKIYILHINLCSA